MLELRLRYVIVYLSWSYGDTVFFHRIYRQSPVLLCFFFFHWYFCQARWLNGDIVELFIALFAFSVCFTRVKNEHRKKQSVEIDLFVKRQSQTLARQVFLMNLKWVHIYFMRELKTQKYPQIWKEGMCTILKVWVHFRTKQMKQRQNAARNATMAWNAISRGRRKKMALHANKQQTGFMTRQLPKTLLKPFFLPLRVLSEVWK